MSLGEAKHTLGATQTPVHGLNVDCHSPVKAECGNKHHPVPEEHVDVLVVEINGQDTLYGVRMYVDHVLASHFEVAQRHAWKRHVTLIRPVLVRGQIAHHVEAERVILGSEDDVEKKQLTDHVDDVEDFRDNE